VELRKEIHNLLGSYHLKSGVYHFYRNEFAQAVRFLRKALDNATDGEEGEGPTVLFYLTQTYLAWAEASEEEGDVREAQEACRKAIEVQPDYPDLHYRLGRLLDLTGRPDEAAASYRRAIELNPDYIEAHRALGFTCLRVGSTDEAGEAFASVFSLSVGAIEKPYRSGLQALQAGDLAASEMAMREAFLRRPDLFDYHYRRGLRLLKAGKYPEAAEHLEAASDLGPRFADLVNYLGVAYAELGRTEEAIAAFRRSVESNAAYLVARLNLAFTLAQAGQGREAEEELVKALEIQPHCPPARAKLDELRGARKVP
jgi:tetratricopeptide (TPR) repeat protein